jgi:hypothetical protein
MEAGISEPLHHEPPTNERFLMLDYATTQAQSQGPLLPPHNQWAIDEVDMLYLHLAEVHGISAAQLAECARWHRSDTNPSLARSRTD